MQIQNNFTAEGAESAEFLTRFCHLKKYDHK